MNCGTFVLTGDTTDCFYQKMLALDLQITIFSHTLSSDVASASGVLGDATVFSERESVGDCWVDLES